MFIFFEDFHERLNKNPKIKKYSTVSQKWETVAKKSYKYKRYCLCAFMDKIYLFGGYDDRYQNRPKVDAVQRAGQWHTQTWSANTTF